jgi:hypothetical protein
MIRYTPNNDIESILKLKNIKLSDKIKNNKNRLDCDLYFTSYIYKTKKTVDFIYKTNFSNIFMHPRQLFNLFNNNININTNGKNIIVNYNNEEIKLLDFIKSINNYSYDDIINLTIKNEHNNLSFSRLLLLVFIGNENQGKILIDKINNYKSLQEFAIVFIIKNNITTYGFNIESFTNYAIYRCNEFGNDIVPSLLVYSQIRHLNFEYIMKLHTKSNSYFNKSTDFLLTKTLDDLLTLKNNNCSTISCSTISYGYFNYEKDKCNLNLYKKYKNLIHNKYFSQGTIFLINKEKLYNTLLFFIDNYKFCVFNNMYDDNSVNRHNSYIHFIERLFGLI